MQLFEGKYLDTEEKELIESYSNIDITKLTKPSDKDQNKFKKIAKDFLKKETKMNIRIDPTELEMIKEKAAKEGLKYQTFIKSILHKYLIGQLVEKDKIIFKKN